jgi:hypothetical protein
MTGDWNIRYAAFAAGLANKVLSVVPVTAYPT